MVGMIDPMWRPKTAPAPSTTYPGAIQQGAQDYDNMMGKLDTLYNDPTAANNQASLAAQYNADLNKTPVNYQPIQYNKTADVTKSLGNLSDLADTGGYSAQGIADLRARGVSPIRAAYGNAMRDITRQRSLQGGYSPNYTAAMAKLTRDLAESTSTGIQNVNAGIAQNVASNKIAITPQYAGAAMNEQQAGTDVNKFNASNKLTADVANANNRQNTLASLSALYSSGTGDKLKILEAMKSLYGTTPANAELYGRQAATNRGLDLQQQEMGNRASSVLMNQYGRQPIFG
jgi:hypothetical protein